MFEKTIAHGSILAPSCDSFLVIDDIDFASYASDNLMYCGGNSMITSFFHCKILLRKCFSKVKPNRVKQPKKKKYRQMPFTFEQKLRNSCRSS